MATYSNRIILILFLILAVQFQFATSTSTFVGSYSGVLIYNQSVGNFSFNITPNGLVNGYGSIGEASGNFSGRFIGSAITGQMILTENYVNQSITCTINSIGTLAPSFIGGVSCPINNATTNEIANGYGTCTGGDCSSEASLHGTYSGMAESDRGFGSFTVSYLPTGRPSGSISNTGVSLTISDEASGIVSTHPSNISITTPNVFVTSVDFPKIEECTASGTSSFFPSFSSGMRCYITCNNTICSSLNIIIGYASCNGGPCYYSPAIYNNSTNNSSPPVCNEDWNCTNWGQCNANGSQVRTCNDLNNCNTITYKPSTKQDCGPCVGVSCPIGQQCQNGNCINQTLNESKNATTESINVTTNLTTVKNFTNVTAVTNKPSLLTGFINWLLGLFGAKK